MSAIGIGRIGGFTIRIHVSWTIILALIVVTVVAQVGSLDPDSQPGVRWAIGAIVAIGFLLSAIAHELAHAVVARRRGAVGDDVTVYFLGAAASPSLVTTRPRDEVAVSLAGPFVSLALGVVLIGIAIIADGVGSGPAVIVSRIALVVGTLDVAMGLLNLIPAYPMDGGRVVRALAWARTGDAQAGLRTAATVGRLVGLGLAIVGVVAILLIDSVDGLMTALAGWFIVSTARGLERRAGLDALFDGITVRDVMERDVSTIPPGLTIDTFASQVLGGAATAALPVMRGGELLGLIGARQLRRLRPDRWATTRAEDLMVKPPTLPIVGPDTTLRSAIDTLARSGLDGLPVVEEGELTGLVTRRAVAEAARERAENAGSSTW